jgi:predicted NBD/HSP70 family sugar kinase
VTVNGALSVLPAASPALLRRINAARVLEIIRRRGPLARSEIARLSRLSKPTVKEVCELLLEGGYVRELPPPPTAAPRPGPRARLLGFAHDLGLVLGVDVGANKVLVLASDLDGRVLVSEERRRRGAGWRDADALLKEVRAAIEAARDAAGSRLRLLAAGIGTPGVVDPASGRLALAPQIPGWEEVNLERTLGPWLGCPMSIANEVDLSLKAERWRGAASEAEDAVYVQLGVGIGCSLLIRGELYRGATGAAGEIGYLPLGSRAGSGLGRFEWSAGGTAFARLGQQAALGPRGALLRELADGDPAAVDAEVVFAAAARGDAAAAGIVRTLTRRIARGLAAVAAVVDPSVVILGGGISRAGQTLLGPLERHLRGLLPRPPRLVLSTLGNESVALGAVKIAIEAVEERMLSVDGLEIG